MKIWNDKKIIALAIILTVFTIGYFIIINKVSYAFSKTTDLEDLYELTIDTIKTTSIVYANQNQEKFGDSNTIVIKVQDLIDSRLLIPNNEGKITNPMNSNENLNSKVITIKYNDGKYEVKVDN